MQKLDKKKGIGLRVFLTVNLVALAVASASAAQKASDKELDNFKVVSQLRLESARDLLKKDIQTLGVRVDSLDKRIDSQNTHIDQSLSLLSIVLGVLGIVFAVGSLVGYFSVRSRALKQAEASAEEWFNNNAATIQAEIESLREKFKGLEVAADTHYISHKEKMKEKETLADKAIIDLQKLISSPQSARGEKISDAGASASQPLSDQITDALAQVALATKDKPESKFDFTDYNIKAFDAFWKGDKESAIQFWRSAAYHRSTTSDESYQALLNVGRTLNDIARHDEAITVFDDILDRNSQHSSESSDAIEIQALNGKALSLLSLKMYDPSLKVYDVIMEKIARAGKSVPTELIVESLGNRALAFEQKGDFEKSLKLYDDILRDYSNEGASDLKSVIMIVTVSALRTLARLKRYEEFDKRFEKMVASFEGVSSPVSKRNIAYALNSKGFSLLCLAKEIWFDEDQRNAALEEGRKLLGEGADLSPRNEHILGNIAYCNHLLGLSEQDVKPYLVKAIDLGGKKLYEGTLDDLEVFPIPVVDAAFRTILDAVMQSHQVNGQESYQVNW